MALSCSVDAIAQPELFGSKVVGFEVNLVKNHNATAYSALYYGHPTTIAENVDFCNITVTYTHPSHDDEIHVETWLPMDNYNGRLQSIGGGGWVAGRYSPSYVGMSGAVAEGYATSTMDAGLTLQPDFGPDSWALVSEGNPNLHLLNQFGSVSLNEQVIISKSLIQSFYGEQVKYSYWSGCSQGGRQGMMLAQRYPDAYDGIHASAPAIQWNELFASTFWPQLVMQLMEFYPYPCELSAITDEAIEECDGLDGIVDGFISNDVACKFDPLSVVGKTFNCSDTGKNMTISNEAAVLAKTSWSGPETEEALTNDIGLAMTSCSSNGTCVGVPNMTRRDFETYLRVAKQSYESLIGTSDPDLTAFHKIGGKILGYHGMSDQIIPVKGTRHYYNKVREIIPDVDSFYRVFEVPGLAHCSGGNGGQPVNTFDALRAWVENGTVPENLPHSFKDKIGDEQNRLLCPYPKTPKFKKHHKGKTFYQSNDFTCA
ncbi:hypothetical protein HG530_008096 [Fusarium avenaceum]|nr:hypothetical protein HG530_008096 [Fusarium avenaceum]